MTNNKYLAFLLTESQLDGSDIDSIPTWKLIAIAKDMIENRRTDSNELRAEVASELQKRIASPERKHGTVSNRNKEEFNALNLEILKNPAPRTSAALGASLASSLTHSTGPVKRSAPLVSGATSASSEDCVLAKCIKNHLTVKKDDLVAVKYNETKTRVKVIPITDATRKHDLAIDKFNQYYEVVKESDGKPKKVAEPKLGAVAKKSDHILNFDKPEDIENRKIEERFKEMLESPTVNHMMINALAGSGKTTMLKHLAWKFGPTKNPWLYLVFNTKNKIDAQKVFPKFVDVQTTNGFLGHLLKNQIGRGNIPPTIRMPSGADKSQGYTKIRALTDTDDFKEFALEVCNLPNIKNYDKNYLDTVMTASSKMPKVIIDTYKKDIKDGMSEHDAFLKLVKTIKTNDKIDKNNFYYNGSNVRKAYNKIVDDAIILASRLKASGFNPEPEDGFGDKTPEQYIQEIMGQRYWNFEQQTIFQNNLEKNYPPFARNRIVDDIARSRNTYSHYNYSDEDMDAVYKLAYWLLLRSVPGNISHEIEIAGKKFDLGKVRDLDDDIWLPALYANKISWPKFDVILVDEAQDFNINQQIVIKNLAEQGANIVAVGDPNQAIYRFRGADTTAFSALSSILSNMSENKDVEKTLTRNFRSTGEILDYVNKVSVVKNLKAGKSFSFPGIITEDTKFPQVLNQLVQEKEREKNDPDYKMPETAFISRTNDSLTNVAAELLARNIPYLIIGHDDLSDNLIKLPKLLGIDESEYENIDIMEYEERVNKYYKKLEKEATVDPKKLGALARLGSTLQMFFLISHNFLSDKDYKHNLGGFMRWLKDRSGDIKLDSENENEVKKAIEKKEEKNSVILTTAHRSKGAEFDRVYLLRRDLFGSKVDKKHKDIPDLAHEEDNLQEDNMFYVALTRAIKELHVLSLKDQPGVQSGG